MIRARSAEVSVEVAGTPEEAWDAIATGPGITAWFVPAEVEEREGGAVSLDVGTGMGPAGTVTGWDPPRRFAYEEAWPALDGEPAGRLATEFHVEARGGGTCVVRIVSSVVASSEAWDTELDNLNEGWRSYLRNLALYMSRHRGQRCATILVTGLAPGSPADGWAALTRALGLVEAGEAGGRARPPRTRRRWPARWSARAPARITATCWSDSTGRRWGARSCTPTATATRFT